MDKIKYLRENYAKFEWAGIDILNLPMNETRKIVEKAGKNLAYFSELLDNMIKWVK